MHPSFESEDGHKGAMVTVCFSARAPAELPRRHFLWVLLQLLPRKLTFHLGSFSLARSLYAHTATGFMSAAVSSCRLMVHGRARACVSLNYDI